jgi:hypothetical protein
MVSLFLTLRVALSRQPTVSSAESGVIDPIATIEDRANLVPVNTAPRVRLSKLGDDPRLIAALDRARPFVQRNRIALLRRRRQILPVVGQAAMVDAPRLGDCARLVAPLH